MAKKEKFCPHCGCIGKPKVGGSLIITLFLALFYIVPGLLYEGWRTSDKQLLCGQCGNKGLIPPASPMAQKFLKENT